MVLLNIAEGTSRVHASRRIFDLMRSNGDDTPVIHHRIFPAGEACRQPFLHILCLPGSPRTADAWLTSALMKCMLPCMPTCADQHATAMH